MTDETKRQRFGAVSTAALVDGRLNAEDIRVLALMAALGDYKTGIWVGSQESLGLKLGVNVRSIRRNVQRLKACKYVDVTHQKRRREGGWGVSRYRLIYPDVDLKVSRIDRTPRDLSDDVQSAQPAPVESSLSRGCPGDVPGDNAPKPPLGDGISDCDICDNSCLPQQNDGKPTRLEDNPDETVGLSPSKPFEKPHEGDAIGHGEVERWDTARSSDGTRDVLHIRPSLESDLIKPRPYRDRTPHDLSRPDPYKSLIRMITSMIRVDETAAGEWVTKHTDVYDAHAAGTLTEAALYQALAEGGIA